MTKHSPTSLSDRQKPKKRPPIGCRREPPQIFVRGKTGRGYGGYCMIKAHLRNKRGYVYLCWRENDTVRNFYLGKAPRSCPTTAAPDPAAGSSEPGPRGRAKNSPKNRARIPQDETKQGGSSRSTPENRRKYAQ
jgi:hypothetical protein